MTKNAAYVRLVLLMVALLVALPACTDKGSPESPPETQPSTPAAQGQADEQAAKVAEHNMEAMGGRPAWEATRHIRFNFAGRRTHYWDKATGRHRLEGERQEGGAFVTLQNLNTREGSSYVDGEKVEGENAAAMLESAYRAWINDTYWLLMPYKLRDPGVTLTYQTEEEINGQVYDVLHLSFESVGLTPGDQYWAYVNRNTGLMDRWAFRLQNMEASDPPSVWAWTGWKKYGRIMLAPGRTNLENKRELPLSDIAVFESLPDQVYMSAEPVQPGT